MSELDIPFATQVISEAVREYVAVVDALTYKRELEQARQQQHIDLREGKMSREEWLEKSPLWSADMHAAEDKLNKALEAIGGGNA